MGRITDQHQIFVVVPTTISSLKQWPEGHVTFGIRQHGADVAIPPFEGPLQQQCLGFLRLCRPSFAGIDARADGYDVDTVGIAQG